VSVWFGVWQRVLKIFGHEGERAGDIAYVNWLNMARAGLMGLEFFRPETGRWVPFQGKRRNRKNRSSPPPSPGGLTSVTTVTHGRVSTLTLRLSLTGGVCVFVSWQLGPGAHAGALRYSPGPPRGGPR
jgi:hypothetical protein